MVPALAGPLRPGDYMNIDVLAALRASRSPKYDLKEAGHGPQVIKVERGSYGLRFIANLNWHEGWTIYTLSPRGALQRGETDCDYSVPRLESDISFQFKGCEPDTFWRTYIWVGMPIRRLRI